MNNIARAKETKEFLKTKQIPETKWGFEYMGTRHFYETRKIRNKHMNNLISNIPESEIAKIKTINP